MASNGVLNSIELTYLSFDPAASQAVLDGFSVCISLPWISHEGILIFWYTVCYFVLQIVCTFVVKLCMHCRHCMALQFASLFMSLRIRLCAESRHCRHSRSSRRWVARIEVGTAGGRMSAVQSMRSRDHFRWEALAQPCPFPWTARNH